MRHRIREQSYIDPKLRKQVQAYEAAKRWTHSAFTEAAYPQHYAMLALGLVTGRRPSELRPLRT